MRKPPDLLGSASTEKNPASPGHVDMSTPTDGSGTKRLLCIPVQSTYQYKTRGEEQWHCPPRGEADAHTRKPCYAEMGLRAPSKPCLRATFSFRFLKRLARKTICFSKTTQMHDIVLGLFVNRYAFGRAA